MDSGNPMLNSVFNKYLITDKSSTTKFIHMYINGCTEKDIREHTTSYFADMLY